MPAKQNRITLSDISEKAEVSVNTAAKVLAGQAKKARISPKTAKKVEKIANQLGYVPNIMARNLRAQQTGIIGVFIADMSDSAYILTSQIILKQLHDKKFSPILTVAEIGRKLCMHEWLQNRIEGLVLCGTTDYMTADFFEELKNAGIVPIIAGCAFRDPNRPATTEVSTVSMDNYAGMQMAIDHLLEKGKTKIAHLAGPPWHIDAWERRQAYENNISNIYEPIIIDYKKTDHFWKSGYDATAHLDSLNITYDSIIAYGDQFAIGSMKWQIEHNRKIPEDVAIVGFDNSPVSASCSPSLTTIAQPFTAIGRRTVHLLKESLYSEPSIERIQITPSLVVRQST